MFGRSAPKRSYGSEISIPGATVTVPPPVGERIFYAEPSVEAFSDPAEAGPLPAEDALRVYPNIEQTVFQLRRSLGECALRYASSVLNDPWSNSLEMHDALSVLPALPSQERLRIIDTIMGNPLFDAMTKQSAEKLVAPVKYEKYAGKTKIAIVDSDIPHNGTDADLPLGQLFGQTNVYNSIRHWQEQRERESLTSSPLHQKASSRVKKFRKTGSETFILPKEHEASVRIIPIEAANAWLSAFENWPVWFKAGFNYVPIEPIQSIHPSEDIDKVAVVTTSLPGRSHFKSIHHYKEHQVQLGNLMKTIKAILWDDMRISHRHPHANNFVIVPYQSTSGSIDKTRCPKLYMIDFDAARQY